MNKFKVISFYTPGSYEQMANDILLPSLQRLELEFECKKVEDQGSWLANIAHKPTIILNALIENKPKNIVYLDTDAVVQCYPKLFDSIPEECDIAFHVLDHNVWYRTNTNKKEVFNGTIFFRNNDNVLKFVTEWRKKCFSLDTGEHIWFERLVNSTNLKCYYLPIEYSYIFSLPDGKEPYIKVENPVIIHYQASRRFKRKQTAKNRL